MHTKETPWARPSLLKHMQRQHMYQARVQSQPLAEQVTEQRNKHRTRVPASETLDTLEPIEPQLFAIRQLHAQANFGVRHQHHHL